MSITRQKEPVNPIKKQKYIQTIGNISLKDVQKKV